MHQLHPIAQGWWGAWLGAAALVVGVWGQVEGWVQWMRPQEMVVRGGLVVMYSVQQGG